MTEPAAAVVVVIRYEFSEILADVPSSITNPSSLNISPYLTLPTANELKELA
jgi:type IV secretory pathway component VirB8